MEALPLIGRHPELKVLHEAFTAGEAELVAVIGRRRVGKTFLIRRAYAGKIAFEITGLQNATKAEQLHSFTKHLQALTDSPLPLRTPDNWLDAFHLLITHLEEIPNTGRKVVFFDELPWLATHRSGFLRAFGYFWNSWASTKNMVVVICGSAASWMIRKVVRNKGGLYNRITRRIYLQPFNLAETSAYLQSRNIRLDHYQIVQLYMAMGGIPHYLKEVRPGRSAIQNVDTICFSPQGLLNDEFSALYEALFDRADRHIAIIRTLAAARYGLSRSELIQRSELSDGGGTSKVLEELVSSGFILSQRTFGHKKKETCYRLIDEYSLFYLKFIEPHQREGGGTWLQLSQSQTWQSWSGYAFEGICWRHIAQIKSAMSIAGIHSTTSTYHHRGDAEIPGVQIDLLLDRSDQVISLFELKFYRDNPLIDKQLDSALRRKLTLFRKATKTKKHLQLIWLSTFPLIDNQYSTGIIDQAFDMDILFQP